MKGQTLCQQFQKLHLSAFYRGKKSSILHKIALHRGSHGSQHTQSWGQAAIPNCGNPQSRGAAETRAASEEKNVLIELRNHIYLTNLLVKPWSREQAASQICHELMKKWLIYKEVWHSQSTQAQSIITWTTRKLCQTSCKWGINFF